MSNKAAEYAFYDLGGPIAVAHRGGDAAGVDNQNTLAAFDAACRLGYVYGETDVTTNAEGVPVISHDKLKKDQSAGALRFEELLMTFPDMRFFVDVKTPETAKPLASLILKLKAQDRLSLRGDNYQLTKDLLDYLDQDTPIATCLGKLGQRALRGAAYSSTLRSYIENSPAASFQMRHNKTSAQIVEIAQGLGKRVLLWTPNTKEDIQAGLDKGADGIFSDRIELLKQIILARDSFNPSIGQ